MAQQTRIIIVPGWRDSGPGHWQTLWQEQLQTPWPAQWQAPEAPAGAQASAWSVERVVQDDWLTPQREAWVGALERLVLARPGPVVIVAHSLGCITTTHLGDAAASRVQGALLVAPADPERRGVLADFAPVPYAPLPYRSILVASNTDPFCPVRLAGAYARAWGSEFVRLQDAGHINVESGHGHWPLGWGLLQSLLSEVQAPQSPTAPLSAAAQAVAHGEIPPLQRAQA